MEVSGRKQRKKVVHKGPLKNQRSLCQPCSSEGEDLDASGFCQNCQEYLCKTCIKHHRKTKHHTILDKDQVPKKNNLNAVKQLCTTICEKHALEIITFFCKDHDTVVCSTCMDIDHTTCKVDFIPDIADTFADGPEYIELLDNLGELQLKVTSMKEKLQAEKERNADVYTEAVEEIRTFRKEIEEYLDKMEQNILAECNKINIDNEKVTKQMEDDLDMFKSELDTFQERLTTHSNETADMFVKANQTKSNLSQLKKTIERKTSCSLNRYEFKRNTDVEAIINRNYPFGLLDLQASILYLATSIGDLELTDNIDVKMSSDKNVVNITSMIPVTSNVLLCADFCNNSVKVVDTNKKCVSSQVCLTSGPWDITAICSNKVAVTLPCIEEIQILTFIDEALSVSRKIKVIGQCKGIAYHQANLIVSFITNAKLQILGLDGNVLRTFPTSFGDNYVLDRPIYIDVSHDCFYVSDFHACLVLKLAFDGKLLGTYYNSSRKRGITVCKDGSVLVCSAYQTLHLMSEDCRNVKPLLTKKNGIKDPVSVYYNELTSTLYLSNWCSNNIMVFSQK